MTHLPTLGATLPALYATTGTGFLHGTEPYRTGAPFGPDFTLPLSRGLGDRDLRNTLSWGTGTGPRDTGRVTTGFGTIAGGGSWALVFAGPTFGDFFTAELGTFPGWDLNSFTERTGSGPFLGPSPASRTALGRPFHPPYWGHAFTRGGRFCWAPFGAQTF